MDSDFSNLILALGIFALGFISLGPNILAIIGTSMEQGRREGIRLALGVGLGLGAGAPLWMALTLVVSTTVLSIAGHVAYAVTFSTRPVVLFYRRARRWIDGALGVCFTIAAVKVATYRT